MLLAGLRLENTECGQIVLYLLECSQRRLAIICGRCVESRNGRFRGCPSPAGVKQSLHGGWTYSPETARPVEPVMIEVPSSPPTAVSITLGKNAAPAIPICSAAAATRRPAAA